MKISLFSVHKEKTALIEQQITDLLEMHEIEIDNRDPDIIICVGGDGTFLKAVQSNIDRLEDVCFLGINNGTLGYFYDYEADEIDQAISDLDTGKLVEQSFPLLEGTVVCENETYDIYAVNEVRLSSVFRTLECEVYINEEKLEDFVGNGLTICGQLGSTGLNKSLGGALVDFGVDCLQITPIAPVMNNVYSPLTSSIVFNKDVDISIVGNLGDCSVSFDNVIIEDKPTKINVRKSSLMVRMLLKDDHTFISSIRKSFIK